MEAASESGGAGVGGLDSTWVIMQDLQISLAHAADVLAVEADILRLAAEAELIPHTRAADAITFTPEHLAAIANSRAEPNGPAEALACCIDRDPNGRHPYCRACAAQVLGVSTKTLANWATNGAGPKNIGRPGLPRYRRRDLLVWLTDGQVAA